MDQCFKNLENFQYAKDNFEYSLHVLALGRFVKKLTAEDSEAYRELWAETGRISLGDSIFININRAVLDIGVPQEDFQVVTSETDGGGSWNFFVYAKNAADAALIKIMVATE